VPLRFLFDEHVSATACRVLRERGVEVVHVVEVGLKHADDEDVLEWAIGEARIVVTRNYRDFAPLVAARNAARLPFPGVLFLPNSLPQGSVGGHVQAIERWVAEQFAFDPDGAGVGRSRVTDSFGWLEPPG